MKKIFTVLFVFACFLSYSQSTTLVISQVYGGGGNTGAPYTADFVELHNISGVSQSLAGLSIQYASATSTGVWSGVYALPAASIPAGGYYLIRMSVVGTVGVALPTPDATTPTGFEIAMSGTNGRVALANGTTALTGCPTTGVVDLVGYGTSVCFETTATPSLSNTTAGLRKNNGCTETNSNLADFTVGPPAPRNSASPVFSCSTVITPTLSATTLTAFGNVCINTTAGPNSFTITGSNLTTTDITVGPLAGFSFATTAAGTYTASLTLTQPGGSYSQAVFVKFDPVAIQSYNGNIAINGGGVAAAINVTATGDGVNSMATVATGIATAVTSTSATLAGTYGPSGCSAVTAYGIEYSTVNGFPFGSGTQVPSTNQVAGSFTSDLTGLAAGVTYYYVAYATNGGGTSYGTQMTFTTISLSPVITVTTLSSFGNVCINTTAGPNNFTINGTNITAADITVGPLTGFTFSTTATGTYTSSLTITQPGGSVYSQQVFVQFNPVAVQSYDGIIPVTGAGAPATSVAATGSGVNTTATVTTGSATAITTSSVTLAGSIPAIGCSAVSVYGIEYSTTNGFPNGTGTAVISTNLASGSFSSNLAGLTPSTTYYYKAYATNAGGTTYGVQQTFTTASPVITATPLTAFGAVCINTTSAENTFTISSTGLTTANVIVGPKTGYEFSTTATGTYTASLSLAQPGGPYSQAIFVKFSPVAVLSYSGSIPVSGGGATAINVAVSGNGVNTGASVTTGTASAISPNAATLAGSVTSTGCSPVTSYGIEYSGISNYTNGYGTKVAGSNLSGTDFTVNLNSLVQATTYYYKAYATSSAGTVYGSEQSFTTKKIPEGLVIYSTPITRGGNVHYTLDSIKTGHYQVKIINSIGQLVYQREIILQVDFIDDNFILPGYIGTGLYTMQIYNHEFKINKTFMVR